MKFTRGLLRTYHYTSTDIYTQKCVYTCPALINSLMFDLRKKITIFFMSNNFIFKKNSDQIVV